MTKLEALQNRINWDKVPFIRLARRENRDKEQVRSTIKELKNNRSKYAKLSADFMMSLRPNESDYFLPGLAGFAAGYLFFTTFAAYTISNIPSISFEKSLETTGLSLIGTVAITMLGIVKGTVNNIKKNEKLLQTVNKYIPHKV